MHALSLLREMGLDPASTEARRAVGLVRDRVTWQGCGPQECDGNPFFTGEVEPCINGQVTASGAYFGRDVRGIVFQIGRDHVDREDVRQTIDRHDATRLAITDADVVDDCIETSQRIHLIHYRSHVGEAGNIADDDRLTGRKRRPCRVCSFSVPGMDDDVMSLLDKHLAREQAQAVRRSGDEDACPQVALLDGDRGSRNRRPDMLRREILPPT